MKRFKLFALAMLVALASNISAFAYSFCVDGIYYDIISSTDLTCAVTHNGKKDSDGYLKGNAYSGEVTIPEKVTYEDIEYNVTVISDYAFYKCSELTSVEIPNSVSSIGYSAFSGCDNLPVVNNIRYADTYLVCAVDKTLSTYSIKEGTRFIGSSAFGDCSNLTSIEIPNSVTSIGYGAFSGCDKLPVVNNIRYADTYLVSAVKNLNTYSIKEGTRFIGDNAFSGCYSLTSVEIPSTVISIGAVAFSACYSLTSVEIPNSVTSIGKGSFDECHSLTSVEIPNSVTSIGDRAFMNVFRDL